MKIILAVMKYDYGDEKRGYSYEYYNFYLSLQQMGYEIIFFDFMTEYQKHGKQQMNLSLLKLTKKEQPALLFCSLYTDQFDEKIVQELRKYTKTLVFFHDDTWRVEYTQHWLNYFDYFTTPDANQLKKYHENGVNNVIHFPFGCNEKTNYKMDIPKEYDVAFVGLWHPYREWLIKKIRKAGYKVFVAGHRWPAGVLDHAEMVKVFNQSKINLNLSNSISWNWRYLLTSPYAILHNLHSKKSVEQIKARHFEINGCGAFQLSYYFEGIKPYYELGKELEVFQNEKELLQMIHYYLEHESQREAIAAAGYQRTLRDHTFTKRFLHAFKQMELID